MPNYHWNIEQGTPEWDAIRLGKFTASSFHTFLGKSQTKTDMLWEIIAERLFKDSDKENFSSYAMERGKILEHEARKMYQVENEVLVRECGFVDMDAPYNHFVGCSPDGLVGEDGGIEIKSPLAKNFLQWTGLNEDGTRTVEYIKPEYLTQVQFNLLVTGRKWWDFMYYHPRGGLAIKRYYPDQEYQNKILECLRDCIQFVMLHTGEDKLLEQKDAECNMITQIKEPSSEKKTEKVKKAQNTKAKSTSTEPTIN